MKKRLHVSTRCSCEILAKIEFLPHPLRDIPRGRTEGETHDKTNNRFSQFCERTQQYNI